MARIPLFFQQSFPVELYGALHDPSAESIVAETAARGAMSLADIVASPGRLPSVQSQSIASVVDVGPRYSVGRSGGGSGGGSRAPKGGGDTSYKGLGSSEESKPMQPKTYKVPPSFGSNWPKTGVL